MALRKLSPGGYEYLTGAVACGDRELGPGESLADYYFAHGYPPGEWFGAGAQVLGVSGQVTQAQMTALFGEGRHPNADAIEARMITHEGTTPDEALEATKLGNRFGRYGAWDELRDATSAAYKDYNTTHGRPVGAPIDDATRATIRADVQRAAFAKAHEDRAPADDQELNKWLARQKAQHKSAVAGYEMIFAPPKSVSVAWALADEPTRELIVSIHRQAVRDALNYFEANAAYTRHGRNGIAQVDIDGIVAATFEHWDSRSGDPHLHTHVPISNKVRRTLDQHWTALDGRTVHAAGVVVSEFYNSRIRDLLREHGATFTAKHVGTNSDKHPVWELDGVPQQLLGAFSQRTSQVEAERARLIVEFRHIHNREPEPKELLELSKRAQYATRPGKQAPINLAQHRAFWREYAIDHVSADAVDAISSDVIPHRLPAATTPEEAETADLSSVDSAFHATAILRTVQTRHTQFNRWNIESEAHSHTAHLDLAPQQRDQLITQLADTVLRADGTVCLEPPSMVSEPAVLRRSDGQSVFTTHNTARYTTIDTLRAEEGLVAAARRGGGHRVAQRHLRAALRAEKTLNPGQRALVTDFATSGRRVQLALAPAGAGKTTAMRVLATSWRTSGGRVFAFGPSARAAHELGESIDARPRTLHQLTYAIERGVADKVFKFRRGDLLIIDEAVMAGTHTLQRVVQYALARGADVRLIGDDHQLGAVEAGGAVALIARDIGAEHLHQIVRFADPAQARASLAIRAGRPDGLGYYNEKKWIEGGSRETMRDAAHRNWRADLDRGHHSLLIVPVIDDVVALNLQARAQRVARGQVDPQRAVVLHDGTRTSRGDYIVTRFNNRRLATRRAHLAGKQVSGGDADFVKNGDTWRVVRVGASGSLTVTRTDATNSRRADTITLPARYVAAHVELAYAATVNRVQGMTSDTGHNVTPAGLTREQLYTAITRGRLRNMLYVITHQHVADQHQETPTPADPLGVLQTVLGRRGIESSATETLRQSLNESTSLATLVDRHDHAAHLGDDDRYRTLLTRHAPQTLGQKAERALIQTLRNTHDAGFAIDDVLATPELTKRLDHAKDPAALLASRIVEYTSDHPPQHAVNVQPDPADVRRWQQLITIAAPHADLVAPGWDRVWRVATSGKLRGLDPAAAVYDAAGRLAQRTPNALVSDPIYTASVLRSTLDDQQRRGLGHQPALPWLARPDFAMVDRHDGMRDYLRDINTVITTRVRALRDTAAAELPAWTQALGPRTEHPENQQRWEHLIGLAAAYRDTHGITTNDPVNPLGPRVDGTSPQAHAWRTITSQWHPAPPNTDHAASTTETTETPRATASLADLVKQHDQLARHGDIARYRELIAIPVPTALNRPAEDAVIRALRTANDLGWQPENLLANPAIARGLDRVDDPAALLAWRINKLTRGNAPPTPTRDPEPADVARWRAIVRAAHRNANLDNPPWRRAWRVAAAAPIDGLNPDTAVRTAAKEAANDEPKPNPADAIARALHTQREPTATYLRALPWLARPDFTALTSDQIAALHQINSAIRARTRQLRDGTASAGPNWAQALGRRPINTLEARQWNRALELAAAYRATHNIRSNNPDQPLGPQPRHHSTRTRSWNHITNEWSNAMPQPDNTSSRPTAADKATVARTAGTSDRQAILDDRARRLRGERQRDVQRRHADNRAKANSDEYSHLDHERLSHDDSNSNSSSLGY